MNARGAVFAIGVGALVVAAIELASLGLHGLAFGELFSYSAAQAARLAIAPAETDEAPVPDERVSNNIQAIHPYVGYVLDPKRSHSWPVNDYGFLGDPPPFGNEARSAVSVALLGGSVAESTGVFGGDILREELARIPAFRGRTVRMSVLALRGMKQPQQLTAIDWLLSLDARFDVVINLDGFNELVLAGENAIQGTNPFYPRRWRIRIEGIQAADEMEALGGIRFLENLRADIAQGFAASIARFSITANLIQRGIDERLAVQLSDARTALNRRMLETQDGPGYPARGPARPHASELERHADLAAYWSRTSRLLDDRARASGFRYFHFLQPNQWVEGSKTFSEAERALALTDDYFYGGTARTGYPFLLQAGRELVASGVDFTDLTPLFLDVAEARYSDACCHLTREGYREVAQAITDRIREAYAREPER